MESYEPQTGLLNLDPALVQAALDAKREFEIRYILGESDDYEAFEEAWLARGGQQLLDAAEQQFRDLGMIQ